MLMNVFEGILIPFVETTLGAACVFFMRKTQAFEGGKKKKAVSRSQPPM